MDELCNKLEYLTVNSKLIDDIDIIITEINYYDSYNIEIDEVCVSCGHNLTWDIEYTLTRADLNWLNHFGKKYFFVKLNGNKLIDTAEKYKQVDCIYGKLLELFALQMDIE